MRCESGAHNQSVISHESISHSVLSQSFSIESLDESPVPSPQLTHRSPLRDLNGATKADILVLARENNVRFLRLQFTDILGVNKNVELPASQFEKALDGDIMFDGS